MTTSGTYAFGDIQQIDVITEAFERIGRNPASLSSNDIDSARRSLNFLFSDWSNNGRFSPARYRRLFGPGLVDSTRYALSDHWRHHVADKLIFFS